jgi:hypothetical protein
MAPMAPLQPRFWLHSPAVRAAQAGAWLVLCALIVSPLTNSALAQEPLDPGSSMREQVACSACAALSAMMPDGEEPFFYRSFEPANAGSRLHPSLENTAFTYDNALAAMALYACDPSPRRPIGIIATDDCAMPTDPVRSRKPRRASSCRDIGMPARTSGSRTAIRSARRPGAPPGVRSRF